MKIFIIIVIIIFIIYAIIENTVILSVRREKLGNGLKIAHISDLHKKRFGKNNSRLCRKIAAEKPDIIIISGDLVSRTETDFTSAKETIDTLCRIASVYMIYGNHEQSLSDEIKEEFYKIIKSTDAVLLRNSTVSEEICGRKLNITGIEPEYSIYKKNESYRNLDIIDINKMYELADEKRKGETILIAHNPFFAEVYSEWGADYTLSGHIHGGAISLPFTRIGFLSPERKFFPKYSKGVYKIGKMKLLVSSGLGKLRLFNPPEIVIYEI